MMARRDMDMFGMPRESALAIASARVSGGPQLLCSHRPLACGRAVATVTRLMWILDDEMGPRC